MSGSKKRNGGKPALFALIVFVLVFQLNGLERIMSSSSGTGGTYTDNANTARELRREGTGRPKLGDGCHHVFIDVGSNIGVHARFLYEPDRYPDSKKSVKAFAKEFGYPRDNRDYCIFAFEPNPKFEQRHLNLETAYTAMGWHYKPFMAGASNADGNFTMYHSAFEKEEWETGFSAVTPKTLYGNDATARTVEIIRLATWIQNEIEGRRLPQTIHSDIWEDPKVIMKLDAEGLEFKIFPDLLTTGALCNNIHFLMGEFHTHTGHHNYYPMNLTSDGRQILNDRKAGARLTSQLLHLVDITETCMTRITLQDD